MAVTTARRRAHVVMPNDLIEEVDNLVGPRQRSRFVQEAVAEKLRRVRRVEVFDRVVGSLAGKDYPGWETSEAAAEWVHNLRYHPGKTGLPHGESGS